MMSLIGPDALVEEHAPDVAHGGRRQHHRDQENDAEEAPEADLLVEQ